MYEPLIHGGHHTLEVILEDDQTDKVVNEIVEQVFTGVEGDGIVSTFDLDAVITIRLKDVKATAAVQNNLETHAAPSERAISGTAQSNEQRMAPIQPASKP